VLPAVRSNSAWLICERPAFWRHKNKTVAIETKVLH
jgi:hypothetical protein